MKCLVLGADGYLGWPTSMYFSKKGHEVMAVDSFVKRTWELETGVKPLIPVPTLHSRIEKWREITGENIILRVGDLTNYGFICEVLGEFQPDVIVHYGEQPSAPYSMQNHTNAVKTQFNNVIGTLNLLFGMKSICPESHLVKIGTMGEYGTPDADIEEGYIKIRHNGREDVLPFPKQPGSFYHLSKVHDSHNILFSCRTWGLKATDLNQGIVYGIHTEETKMDPVLTTSFHYDSVFGTVLNRFLVQACVGYPLTVYGEGGQVRSFLNILDTLDCVYLAAMNPPQAGMMRVMNQFTECTSIMELAQKVVAAGRRIGLTVEIGKISNPRQEMEKHYYNPKNTSFLELGLKPRLLTEEVLDQLLRTVLKCKDDVIKDFIAPSIRWAQDDVILSFK